MLFRWALTHPLSVDKYEKLKNQQLKPDFLDMVPWYSGYVNATLKFPLFAYHCLNVVSER